LLAQTLAATLENNNATAAATNRLTRRQAAAAPTGQSAVSTVPSARWKKRAHNLPSFSRIKSEAASAVISDKL
jgi:hypothetical protein